MSALIDRLVVVGTGLIGASLAAAAKAQGAARQVIGVDRVEAQQALGLGLIDQACDSLADAVSLNKGSSEAIGIVIATPVTAVPEVFSQIQSLFGSAVDAAPGMTSDTPALRWVTDLCSTKASVREAVGTLSDAMRSRFVSSHPMAGSEKQGATAARADLFRQAKVLICPLPESTDQSIADLESFWIAVGAEPSLMPIEDHDALLASISHLPHALAFSLAGALAQSPLAGAAQALHGGGLRDTTRIAASSPELWADIFLDNRECLLDAWAHWSVQEKALKDALEKNDRVMLIDLLNRAAHWRRGF
jgi:prephenate dehydrogenase